MIIKIVDKQQIYEYIHKILINLTDLKESDNI